MFLWVKKLLSKLRDILCPQTEGLHIKMLGLWWIYRCDRITIKIKIKVDSKVSMERQKTWDSQHDTEERTPRTLFNLTLTMKLL